MRAQLTGSYGEPPREADLYIKMVEVEKLDRSNTSKKHLRILSVLLYISTEKSKHRRFVTIKEIRLLIANRTKKLHTIGDIQSFTEDLCSRGYVQKKIMTQEQEALFAITKKGRKFYSEITQNSFVMSNSPNMFMAFN